MLLVSFLFWIAICISHPLSKNNKHSSRHPPVFDGTDRTIPKTLKDNTVIDEIEEINDNTKNQLFEADIALTKQDKARGVDTSHTGDATGAQVEVESIAHKRKGVRERKKIWPSRMIPVAATSEMGDVRPNILAAIKEIQDVSCIRFKDKQKDDKHWIRFVKKKGCWSNVGREYYVPGAQEISIGPGCNSKGIIMHEIMHALGFWHEQSRTDRDNYLAVLWENVKPGQTKNFNKYPTSDVDNVGGMYDFESIMHYGNYAFSRNKKPTMLALKNPKMQFGTKLKLSKTDIMQLNAIYDCKSRVYINFGLFGKCTVRIVYYVMERCLYYRGVCKERFDCTGPHVICAAQKGGWSSWTKWGPCDRKCKMMRERFCTSKNKTKCPGVDADGIEIQSKRCDSEECNVPLNGHWGRWAAWSTCSATCGKAYQTRSRMCDDPPPQFGGDICEGTLVEVQMCKGKRKKCKKSKKGRSRSRKGEGKGK